MSPDDSCVDIQRSEKIGTNPSDDEITSWITLTLQYHQCIANVSVRLVDEIEITSLNEQFRQRNQPTNVLSFPCDLRDETGMRLLGDIVACEPIVIRQAQEQGKKPGDHWAHIIIHGLLHLMGYDHVEEQQAEEMETLEISLLREIDIDNPYTDSAYGDG